MLFIVGCGAVPAESHLKRSRVCVSYLPSLPWMHTILHTARFWDGVPTRSAERKLRHDSPRLVLGVRFSVFQLSWKPAKSGSVVIAFRLYWAITAGRAVPRESSLHLNLISPWINVWMDCGCLLYVTPKVHRKPTPKSMVLLKSRFNRLLW